MVAYSPNKNLALPTVAGDSGTWGGELNTSTVTPVDLMLGGVNSIALTNANYTLSGTDIQYLTQKLTGILGASVTVYSSCLGFYFVENNTTGAFTVTWQANFGSGNIGTAWGIPQGARVLFLSDATAGARPAFSCLDLQDLTAASTPPSGSMRLYAKTGDCVAIQSPAGVEFQLGKAPTYASLTSGSGTYTSPTGVVRRRIRMVGAGSGSTGCNASSAGGTGGAGAATVFGGWTANGGGAPGASGSASTGGVGGTGGTDGSGTLISRVPGENGNSNSIDYLTTKGGSSPLGYGGIEISTSGVTGTGYGSGASGTRNPAFSYVGGAGAGGEYAEFEDSNPGALSYTVGTGGTAGTGTYPGAVGQGGKIMIEEFYS